jgi:hypothetical protein
VSEWLEAREREWWDRLPEALKQQQLDQIDRACPYECSYVECRSARALSARLAEWERAPVVQQLD